MSVIILTIIFIEKHLDFTNPHQVREKMYAKYSEHYTIKQYESLNVFTM